MEITERNSVVAATRARSGTALRTKGFVRLVFAAAAFVLGGGCSPTEERPTTHRVRQRAPEEVALREKFVADHPELPASLREQVLAFTIAPSDALRRYQFVVNRSDLDSRLRRRVLAGQVGIGMTREVVAASWGEPRAVRQRGAGESAVEEWEYPLPGSHAGGVLKLIFAGEERRLVRIESE